MKILDFIKYLIYKFTPHLVFDRLRLMLTQSDNNLLARLNKSNNIYIFLACDYANLGDYAITKAQKQLLQQFYPDRTLWVFPTKYTYIALKTVMKTGKKNDLVTIIGGGNMSELYYGYERKRNLIVKCLPHNNIISFPQSIGFSENYYGKLAQKRSAAIYSRHKHMTFMARDKKSFKTMLTLFPNNKIVLIPDVVLTLSLWTTSIRNNIVIAIRNDREGILTEQEKKELISSISTLDYNIKFHDTTEVPNTIQLENAFASLIHDFSSAKLIVTDRLHGMILAYVTGTPAIVIPNSNGKIEYGYEWILNCNYIRLLKKDKLFDIRNIASEMMRIKPSKELFNQKNNDFIFLFKNVLSPIATSKNKEDN